MNIVLAVGALGPHWPQTLSLSRRSLALQITTLLVLLARPARTGVVAADLLAPRGAHRGLRPRGRGGGAAEPLRELAAGLPRVGPGRHGGGLPRRVADQLDLEEALHDGRLHPLDHVLEEIECLLLVLGERVTLAVAAEADPFLEVVDRQQVVLPLLVDDDHHLVAL